MISKGIIDNSDKVACKELPRRFITKFTKVLTKERIFKKLKKGYKIKGGGLHIFTKTNTFIDFVTFQLFCNLFLDRFCLLLLTNPHCLLCMSEPIF